MTTRERLPKPSLPLAVWGVLLVGFFVVRGDLRIAAADPLDAAASPRPSNLPIAPPTVAPVVVKAERGKHRANAPMQTCRGRVIDALGFLVVGAEVQANGTAARTDADGRFQLEVVHGQPLDVLVRSEGLQARRVRVWPTSPDPLVLQLPPAAPWDGEPAALPAPSRLQGEGLVRTENGSPAAFAWVTAIGGDAWSRADEIGRYTLPLPGPQVTLFVHQPDAVGTAHGLAARSESIDVGRTEGVVPLPELVATAAAAIRGVVRDPRGTPIDGVPVQLRGPGITRVLETGPGGAFHVGGLQAGKYTVRPFAFRGALGTPTEITLADAVVDCDLHLQSAEERRLRLLDRRGEPVSRAYVATGIAGERSSVAQTDAAGWTAVVMCEADRGGVEFEVRTGPDHEAAAVHHYDAGSATLVVGLE